LGRKYLKSLNKVLTFILGFPGEGKLKYPALGGIWLLFAVSTFAQEMGESLPIRIALSQESPPTSYVVDGHPAGMFKEILEALFELLPQYKPQFRAYPWNRAQFQG